MEFILTPAQRNAFDRIENEDRNFFLNGAPGVGKSVLIRALLNEGRKDWMVAAPTGLAALNANGKTLHSMFRIPVSEGIIDPTYNLFSEDRSTVMNLRFNLRYLLIDEVSMVRADTFDFINRYLQHVKNKPGVPFGGVQVVAVGDFFQLSPICRAADKKQLKEAGYESEFAFDSFAWQAFEPITLTEVLRQKGDRTFIDILRSARTGELTPKQMVLLNDRVDPDIEDLRVRLCATNAQADEVNIANLKKLDASTEVTFEAKSYGNWPALPADPVLRLRIGAQVMVRLNKADRPPQHTGQFDSDVVNGTLGVVVEINLVRPKERPYDITPEGDKIMLDDRDEDYEPEPMSKYDPNVVIEVSNGTRRRIFIKRWERKIKTKTEDGWSEEVVASYEQMPLSLAWAISMHKSQGQTFEAVHIDASKIFAAGQFYVALSRCKTLEGVSLEKRVNKDRIYCDKRVKAYFDK